MITIDEFKTHFNRDFPFLPLWDLNKTYNKGETVYYENNRLFYTCLNNGVESIPPDAPNDWQEIQDDIYNYVTDADIEKAMSEMEAMLNKELFDENSLRLAQLYLTAHCLVHDIRTSNGGLASSFAFPMQSRSVGSVSESYGIPRRFLDKEIYSFYITSGYGLKFLALYIPRSRGNVGIAYGRTLP